ncbi:sensor histidine kinase [Haloglycomyces albus]|uniref:sensor histidine kinase n=1 Tax=Haloglycomyces albus TaxID=526067 RepID=UPI00046CBA29|nr:sensor histidine kinase [Haloglycomyces albus]
MRVTNHLRRSLRATGVLIVGIGTSLLAASVLLLGLAVAVLCLVGIGIALLPWYLRLLRLVANVERRRLKLPYPSNEPGIGHDDSRRELYWLGVHATWGLLLGVFGLQAGVNAVRELTFPLWWYLLPPEGATVFNGIVYLNTWPQAWLATLLGVVWAAVWIVVIPRLPDLQHKYAERLLSSSDDLLRQVEHLTTTRAAALDAHAVELRRIERALHDGAQNRLVGVTMLSGAARQALHSDPRQAERILERLQSGAEEALAELRSVVRSILPPVLEDRGLDGALRTLAAESSVPCTVRCSVGRSPAGVEATIYFVVAEALTNTAKHSEAGRAWVEVTQLDELLQIRIGDNGAGGARAEDGTGLAGIKRRVEAHDGRVEIHSAAGQGTTIEAEIPCG